MLMLKARFFIICALSFVLFFAHPLSAQDDPRKKPDKEGGPVVADFSEGKEASPPGVVQLEDLPPDVPVSDFVEGTPQSQRQYIYEKPSLKNLANLFWALNFSDVANDAHIDYYLRLTECEIFRKFISSEFEMKEIREATRKFVIDNRNDFSMRFELVQQIYLRDYDLKRRAFKIDPKYQIQSVRRFEMITSDNYSAPVCGKRPVGVGSLPLGLILEFSRPFTLTYVPAPTDVAAAYLEEADKKFQKLLDKSKNQERAFDFRKAYLVMFAKAFAFRKVEPSRTIKGASLLQTMAVLEGVEVYGDPGRKQLFFSKSFLSTKSPKEVSESLQKEYEILKEKYKGAGMFH
jgi:hypothetical protein